MQSQSILITAIAFAMFAALPGAAVAQVGMPYSKGMKAAAEQRMKEVRDETEEASGAAAAQKKVEGAVEQGGNAAAAVGGAPAAAAGAASVSDSALVGELTQKLGVTETQAAGGAGSIFQLAQQKMSPGDFSSVSAAVPEMSALMGAAPKPSGMAGLAGAAASLGGGSGGTLGALAGLAGPFSQLGMSTSMVPKFVPIVVSYVEQKGGSATGALLQSALMPSGQPAAAGAAAAEGAAKPAAPAGDTESGAGTAPE